MLLPLLLALMEPSNPPDDDECELDEMQLISSITYNN